MNTRIARWSGVMAAALLAVGVQGALAQPGGGPGHGHGHGGGFAIERVLASLKGQLSLNTSQQLMWDNAVAQTKAARATGRTNFESVRTALNAELAKPEPDFAAVAAAGDAAQASNQTLRKQVRDQWLQLYATFSPAQKGVVRDAVKARVARMEAFREKMKERMQSRSQGNG
jgi:Spy/CpxP family protein refolding chaperone